MDREGPLNYLPRGIADMEGKMKGKMEGWGGGGNIRQLQTINCLHDYLITVLQESLSLKANEIAHSC